MKGWFRPAALALTCLAGGIRPAAPQQPGPAPSPAVAPGSGEAPYIPTFRIVGQGRPKVSIAVPAFQAAAGDGRAGDLAGRLRDVVRDDLDFSGHFDVVRDEHLRLVPGDPHDRRVRYKDWLGVGGEALLLGRVLLEPAALLLEGQLHDTMAQRVAIWKRYRGEGDQERLLAHRLADEIVRQYTGEPGIAQTRIAFVSQVGKAKEIFVMDYDGARAKRITGNGSINLSPAWSPDGREIAFMTYRTGRPELMILNGAGEMRRAFPQSGELNSAPAWSPDGRLLAFSSSRDGNAEIYTLRVADGTLARLTTNDAIDTSPAWAPNGREIAFTSDRSGAPQIYVMDDGGGNVRRLTFDVSYCDAASWSPQGDRIAFTARVAGGFDIHVRDLGTGALLRLTEGTGINEWPRFSPDGRHLVFASNRTGGFDIYTMDADGGRVRRLTRGGNNTSPAWSR